MTKNLILVQIPIYYSLHSFSLTRHLLVLTYYRKCKLSAVDLSLSYQLDPTGQQGN